MRKHNPRPHKQPKEKKTRVRPPKGWQHEKFYIDATPEEIAKAIFAAGPLDEPETDPDENPDQGSV